ncbi:ammonium transporter [Pseudogemmobacter faecipullorum]|uniref:Ammonium transporter n=1 Tax=Pseudogemmobacter faecipullorum TaxID=2755041 RepID=A0ABS8CQG0_9RHOB|nr:ammonium transporter [Pseudogemmobacter faecipullorum]MCB5411435.1 ammonium transporter [Pseudogemmobacter faecipullorum]
MSNFSKLSGLTALAAPLLASLPAWAQEAAETVAETAAGVVEEVPAPDSGDTAWMLISTALVLFMIIPGVALFYGGLVRSKNMLSVLMQTTTITAMCLVIYVLYGYSFAFGGGEGPYFGGFDKLLLAGIGPDTLSGSIPEYVFISFQATFAAITSALIIGGFAERIKFRAVLLFIFLWVTIVYFPVAHMAWDANGLFFGWEVFDFAGGTVVHINAGVAALVGAICVGRRVGYGKDNMAPHSLTLTLVGAGILFVGWFGFNAGSALGANGTAGLAMINTFTATAGGILGWVAVEAITRGKASMLGGASGMIAGLVAVTPAAGAVGPVGAIFLGAIASAGCYYFVAVVKNRFGYDDSLDVFGIHGIGGIIGAVGAGIFAAPALGGQGFPGERGMGEQVFYQIAAVGITILYCAIVSFILFKVVGALTGGLRVSEEAEREGLDLTSHGERAYHN